ncbi:MAG TPA: 5-(carboxyamino)imidazole ribonucleotide synthase [Candidatus Binatia bacterium]|nr:5-(carboxyamino)imidazole ribonucleotide synthase [Candidatus Binatia bacterium]
MRENQIGIVGGGQLGRMLTDAAKPMGFEVTVIDPTEPPCPAAQAGAEQIVAGLHDDEALDQLVRQSAVTTWEIEHIGSRKLKELQSLGLGGDIQPSPRSLEIINDKLSQKEFLSKHGIPVVAYRDIREPAHLASAIEEMGPVIVKSRFGGYDGRGNLELSEPDWTKVIARFDVMPQVYAEQKIDFDKELSVLVARDKLDNMRVYPTIETIQSDGQCNIAVAPARIESELARQAELLALDSVYYLDGAGVFAVEMFLTADGRILVNEIAPRVHNSGHWTIEGSKTSQFEQHVRAITGLPLGSTEMLAPAAAMINILGERDGPVNLTGRHEVLGIEDAHLHVYGKAPTKAARKMGHITVRASSPDKAIELAIEARKELSI